MTTKNNRQQRDRPRWVAPVGARPEVMTPELRASLPEGAMLRTSVRFAGTGETIPVVVRMVSHGKASVTTGRGFDVRKLDGAEVVRLVRADDEVTP